MRTGTSERLRQQCSQLPGPFAVETVGLWTRDPDRAPHYRCGLADGRQLIVWRQEPHLWRYGLVCAGKSTPVPNIFVSPNMTLARADALCMASWLLPNACPIHHDGVDPGFRFSVHPVSGDGADQHNATSENISSEPAIVTLL